MAAHLFHLALYPSQLNQVPLAGPVGLSEVIEGTKWGDRQRTWIRRRQARPGDSMVCTGIPLGCARLSNGPSSSPFGVCAFLPLSLRNILFEIQYCRTMFQSPPLINCMRLVSVKNRLSSFVSRAGHIAIQCSMAVLDVRIRGGHTLNCHPSSTPELHDSTIAGFQLCSCAHALNLFHSGRVPHPPSLSKARSLGSFL